MPSPNLTRTVRKLEDLPSDGGRAIDTLTGATLRLFVWLHAVERRPPHSKAVGSGSGTAKTGANSGQH